MQNLLASGQNRIRPWYLAGGERKKSWNGKGSGQKLGNGGPR